MNKSFSKIPLYAIMSILTISAITLYQTPDAYAAARVIDSFIANDPDDLDAAYSSGDTLTITLDANANVTVATVTKATFVTGNFTFDPTNILGTFTTDWTAEWTNAKTLVITIVKTVGNPVVGTSTVTPAVGNGIGDITDPVGNPMATAGTPLDTLAGDFGLFVTLDADSTTTTNNGGCDNCEAPTLGISENGRRLVDNGFTYNGNPIDVERYFTPYPLVTVSVGKQNIAEFKIYDDNGPDNISHLELAFGLSKDQSIANSKAVINWDQSFDGIETVTVDDPENALDKIEVTTSEGYCSDESDQKCLIVKVVHTFRAPLDFNILGTNVWDEKRNAWQNYYNHGIEIVGESLNPAKEYGGINQGQIYHLTETSKTTAVDEFGGSWTFEYGLWAMDYVQAERIPDTSSVFTRLHSDFADYKETQIDLASNMMSTYYGTTINYEDSFSEIHDIFAYDYPETFGSKLDNSEIQNSMMNEAEKAQKIMGQILDPSQLYR